MFICCVTQDMGPHIFQTCPSANYFDCKAMSIGARSQSARTYLERCMDKFSDCKIEFHILVSHTLISAIHKKSYLHQASKYILNINVSHRFKMWHNVREANKH